MVKRGTKGAIELSFGMIFGIILIIIFIAFGFYAISKFIELQKTIQIESFLSDFQNDVNAMWKSPQGSQPVEYSLPTKITAICFKNDEIQNLEFESSNIINGKLIENIDTETITSEEDPYCIDNIKGKVSFTIVKEFGETLVRVER